MPNTPFEAATGILRMFRSPKALPGRSLAELGFFVPSKLPQAVCALLAG